LRKHSIYLELFTELLSFILSRLWDLDHDKWVDFVDEGDTSSPDPMHVRKLALNIHDKSRMKCDELGDGLRNKSRSKCSTLEERASKEWKGDLGEAPRGPSLLGARSTLCCLNFQATGRTLA
jgi:hypothetical protein